MSVLRGVVVVAAVWTAPLAAGEPATLLSVRGKRLLADDFKGPLETNWKANRGRWGVVDGALRGLELKEDKHAAVIRRRMPAHDLIVQFAFKLDGAQRVAVHIDDAKGHNCLVALTPEAFAVHKASHDQNKTDKSRVLGSKKMPIRPGVWHTLVLEMCGKDILASVDGAVAFGAHDAIDVDKVSFAISVSGESASIKDFRIWEAQPNKEWPATKAKLEGGR
jgi:hypothetical protein